MNERIIRVSPPARVTATLARGAALAAAGAVAGAVVASGAGIFNAIPILVGLAIGLVLGTRTSVVAGADGHLAGGLLAVGCVALGGAAFESGATVAAWPATLLGLGVAASAGSGLRPGRVVASALGSGIGFLGVYALLEGLRLRWGVGDLGVTAAAGTLVGAMTQMGRVVSDAVRVDSDTAPRMVEIEAGAHAAAEPGRGAATGAGELPSEWGAAYRALEERATGLLSMIGELGAQRPDDLVLAGEIRQGVERMVSDARDAVARWSYADAAGSEAARAALDERIAQNERLLEGEQDARVRAALCAALARQRSALALVDEVVVARRTFGFRLEEAAASLDVLRTSLGRALTAGGSLDQAEVDLLVEAMSEAHALFDAELPDVPAAATAQAEYRADHARAVASLDAHGVPSGAHAAHGPLP